MTLYHSGRVIVNFDVGEEFGTADYWYVSIQDSAGQVLAAADTGKNKQFSTGLTEPGTYYLVVEQGSSQLHNTDQYQVFISFLDGVDGLINKSLYFI